MNNLIMPIFKLIISEKIFCSLMDNQLRNHWLFEYEEIWNNFFSSALRWKDETSDVRWEYGPLY